MQADRFLVLVIVGCLLVLSGILVLPYLQFVIAAMLLAFVLYPLQQRLAPRIGRTTSAISLVLLSVVAVILPLLVVVIAIAGDALAWIDRLRDADPDLSAAEAFIASYTGREVDLSEQIASSAEGAVDVTFGGALALFETVTHVLIGLGLLLFRPCLSA